MAKGERFPPVPRSILVVVTGVGTQIKTKSACFIFDGSKVNVNSTFSWVLLLLPKFLIFSSSMSNPIVFKCVEKASANGKPT